MKELIEELGSLAEKLSAGWHEGIEIDASDIMLMNKTATSLEQQAAEIERLQREVVNRNQRALDGDKAVTVRDMTLAENEVLQAKLDTAIQSSAHWQHQCTELQAKLSAMEKQEPVAYAIFTAEGNARMWSTLQPHVQKLADAEGLTVTKLYTAPKVAPLKDDDMGEGHPVLALSTKVDFLISNIKESIECDDFDGAAATLEMLRDCVSKLANGWAGALEASPQVTEPAPKVAQPLTVEAYTAIAHRTASKYAHRSDPAHVVYTFFPHTLNDFVRKIEAAIGGQQP